MDDAVIETVRKEERDLLRKLAAVQVLLRAYGAQPAIETVRATEESAARTQTSSRTLNQPGDEASREPRGKRPFDDFTPYGRQAIATAMSFLVGQAHPIRTRELVTAIKAIGFTIRGDNAMNALGALLGRSADIVSHGKAGWTLADPATAAEIVGKYAHKENEPHSDFAGGSDAAGEGEPPPHPALVHSPSGHDA